VETSSRGIRHIQQLFHERLLVFHFCELRSQVYTVTVWWPQISEEIAAIFPRPHTGAVRDGRILEHTWNFAETNHIYIHLVGVINNEIQKECPEP